MNGALPDSFELEWLVWYNIAAFMMLVLAIIHSYNVVLDLCTNERKCLNHRSSKPKLSKHYKFVQYLTITILISDLLSAMLFAVEMWSWPLQICINLNNAGGLFLIFGKGLTYTLFMYRLYMCYATSAYGYSERFLCIIGGINMGFGFVLGCVTTYLFKSREFIVDDDAFPNPCFPAPPDPGDWKVAYFPVIVMGWDLIMNILGLFLFINPLRKAFKGVKDCNTSNAKLTKTMLRVAIKYTILTSVVSTTTTFCWFCALAILPFGYYAIAFDVAVNCICIMLMTPYYPDHLYYERLCFCCVLLCVPKSVKQTKTQSKGSDVQNNAEFRLPEIHDPHQTNTNLYI
eukprot:196069_1